MSEFTSSNPRQNSSVDNSSNSKTQEDSNVLNSSNSDHLIVLCHGMMGYSTDLNYLGNVLRSLGCVVLQSESNESYKSLEGIVKCSQRLVEEIEIIKTSTPGLKRISFVGNSLGGLFVRYTIMMLYDASNNTLKGLKPHKLMTIATPHLGVRNHMVLEDQGWFIPSFAKDSLADWLSLSGKQLFYTDADCVEDTLLYNMATSPEFLSPLRGFQEKRAYVNLRHDTVVPLGTGGFIREHEVMKLREEHLSDCGIVAIIKTKRYEPTKKPEFFSSGQSKDRFSMECYMETMIDHLDSCGWEKVIVHLPSAISSLAHNKLAALAPGKRYPWIVTQAFGFREGERIMDHAAYWLICDFCVMIDSIAPHMSAPREEIHLVGLGN